MPWLYVREYWSVVSEMTHSQEVIYSKDPLREGHYLRLPEHNVHPEPDQHEHVRENWPHLFCGAAKDSFNLTQ